MTDPGSPPYEVPPPATQAQKAIKDEIVQYTTRIQSLKSQWNTLSPISRLPDDVLFEVFKDIVWIDTNFDLFGWGEDHYGHDAEAHRRVRCPSFTQVCHRWRQLSLDSPSLWQYISLTHPSKWMMEQIRRSQSQPLTLWHFRQCRSSEHVHPLVDPFPYIAFAEPRHVEAIRITTDVSHLASLGFHRPYPIIHTAILRCHGGVYPLPGDLFGRSAPLLRNFSVIDCLPPSASLPALTGLTNLSMTFRQDDWSLVYLNSQGLLEFLRDMPLLERLNIDDTRQNFPQSIIESPSSQRDIHLGRLLSIQIVGHPEYCRFLAHLNCPNISFALLNIQPQLPVAMDDDLHIQGVCRLARHAAERSPTLRRLIFRGVDFRSQWEAELYIARAHPQLQYEEEEDEEQAFTFKCHTQSLPEHTPEQAVVALCEALPLVHLQELQLYDLDRLGGADWDRISACTPNLFKLTLCPYSQAFMDRFTYLSTPRLENRAQNFIHMFPRLQTLLVQEWQFTGDAYWSRFATLRNAALARASDESTSRMKKLIINNCSISREQIEGLRAIVKVEWDGIMRSGTQIEYRGSFDVHNDGADDDGDGDLELHYAADWGSLDEEEIDSGEETLW
ncbi:hypothetical protein HGRIS_011774 [Hohenbuehelia grisea]|uniref:F-box domain-containing protein n=1 Tax=Hohenbuehelia grisea TaxID=104357 RepID=A0ABR3JW51_9AGAR